MLARMQPTTQDAWTLRALRGGAWQTDTTGPEAKCRERLEELRREPICSGLVLMDGRGVVIAREQRQAAHLVERDVHVPAPEQLEKHLAWTPTFKRRAPRPASIDAVDTSRKPRAAPSEAQISRMRMQHKQRFGSWPSRRTLTAWRRMTPAQAARVIDGFDTKPAKTRRKRSRMGVEIANWAERQQRRRLADAIADPRK